MKIYTKITSKEISYQLYENGEFGNKLNTWTDVDSVLSDGYDGTVTMRYASKYGKWCKYNIKQSEIREELSRWNDEGADLALVRFNESAPDNKLTIQGEFVVDSEYGYIFSYSTDKVKMREAMALPDELIGNEALNLLRGHLSIESNRNLKRLLDTYPAAVIELSVYDHFLGDIPGNNAVFWEVRNY